MLIDKMGNVINQQTSNSEPYELLIPSIESLNVDNELKEFYHFYLPNIGVKFYTNSIYYKGFIVSNNIYTAKEHDVYINLKEDDYCSVYDGTQLVFCKTNSSNQSYLLTGTKINNKIIGIDGLQSV